MRFFSNFGGALLNGAKDFAEESCEYYNEAMSMSREDLRYEQKNSASAKILWRNFYGGKYFRRHGNNR